MKKKQEVEDEDQKKTEIIKAVAQAWYGHSGSSRPTSEFEAHRRNFREKPSRFKLEAVNSIKNTSFSSTSSFSSEDWDFRQSLWDSYEIVTVSKRLERGLVMDNPFEGSDSDKSFRIQMVQRQKSRPTLLSLFNLGSSRRFDEVGVRHRD